MCLVTLVVAGLIGSMIASSVPQKNDQPAYEYPTIEPTAAIQPATEAEVATRADYVPPDPISARAAKLEDQQSLALRVGTQDDILTDPFAVEEDAVPKTLLGA